MALVVCPVLVHHLVAGVAVVVAEAFYLFRVDQAGMDGYLALFYQLTAAVAFYVDQSAPVQVDRTRRELGAAGVVLTDV